MLPTPPLSVLMTAYNRERYIGAAIESVLAQTFGDFELIVVDDSSTDATVDVAERYVSDPRVRVVVNKSNLGDYPNRNHAASFVRGELFKYHDSDDLMYPHCLATMMDMLIPEPRAGFALSAGRYWVGGPCPMLSTPRMSYQREFLGSGMFNVGPACALFRTSVFRDLGGFPERGVGSDGLFWLEACARVNVLLVPGDLFWYRVHSGQEIQSARAMRDYAVTQGEFLRALNCVECPLEPGEIARARNNWITYLAKLTWADLRDGRWDVALIRLRAAGIPTGDVIRSLRGRSRDRFAGTPLDASGEFLKPTWLQRREA